MKYVVYFIIGVVLLASMWICGFVIGVHTMQRDAIENNIGTYKNNQFIWIEKEKSND